MPITQGHNRNLIQFTLEIKDVSSFFIFKVDFVLMVKDNLCLFALSWLEIKHKTRHCHGESSCIFIHKVYKEKGIKRKIINKIRSSHRKKFLEKQPFVNFQRLAKLLKKNTCDEDHLLVKFCSRILGCNFTKNEQMFFKDFA